MKINPALYTLFGSLITVVSLGSTGALALTPTDVVNKAAEIKEEVVDETIRRFWLAVLPLGHGKGLDADLVDGFHASSFALQTEIRKRFGEVEKKITDLSQTVGTIDFSPYLRRTEQAIDSARLGGELPGFFQDAGNLISGTLSDARLPTNAALLNLSQTFTALKTFAGGLTVSGGTLTLPTGSITSDFILNGTITGSDLASNITILTTGNLTTTSGGTITSAGLLAASSGVSSGGNLTFSTDNSFDIGAAGATRPRSLYVATSGIFGRSTVIPATARDKIAGIEFGATSNRGGGIWMHGGETDRGAIYAGEYVSGLYDAVIYASSGAPTISEVARFHNAAGTGTTLAIGGALADVSAGISLPNDRRISWRNAANTLNLLLSYDSSNVFAIDPGGNSNAVSIGATPATSGGGVRLANTHGINWRNAANSANVRFAFSDKWEFHRALDDLSIINIYTGESGTTGVGIDIQADANAGFYKLRSTGGVNRWEITAESGMTVGAPTGGLKGIGTINVATDIFKNNTAYANPDYAFEHYYTGNIVKFAGNEGASDYPGLLPLSQVEAFAKENYELPRVGTRRGIFERGDILLEKVEEAYLYLFDHEKRLAKLETDSETTINDEGQLTANGQLLTAEKVEAREVISNSLLVTSLEAIGGIFAHVKAQTLDVAGKLTAKTAEIATAVIDNLTAKRARVNELEMVDKATGEVYCTWLENGDWQKVKGECSK